MKQIAIVKNLERAISQAEARIKTIQSECKHERILHTEKPDAYCGWGILDKCLECGKMTNAATVTNWGKNPKPIRKIMDGHR